MKAWYTDVEVSSVQCRKYRKYRVRTAGAKKERKKRDEIRWMHSSDLKSRSTCNLWSLKGILTFNTPISETEG